ncbi:MICOS complex subunit mic25a-like isoform X2 [Brienomyrus brachyistius]|uniref:MICOS complex subunit mic25a-like isoform X2 n=1 Tax=Brienomyrus brachyistius TaxID=42636 RepID=UPI0020B3180C|nr:MICOS complex subunit mic25a-like isoform X2 [Brienomyrus brachyistius]
MGAGESSTRRVSFGLDEEDRVRILNGVKLSEDVLQRMRDAAQRPAASDSRSEDAGKRSGPSPFEMQDELRRRYDRERALVQEELARVARREQEAGREEQSAAVLRERARAREEAERTQQLAKELAHKEAELKELTAFYKEQLTALERKNLEYYQMTSEQYQEAASKAESHIRPRSTAPVCSSLQAQILDCYRDNREQTLSCSGLAKEYMLCVNAAKKNLLANRG